jgi:hypothetical protein
MKNNAMDISKINKGRIDMKNLFSNAASGTIPEPVNIIAAGVAAVANNPENLVPALVGAAVVATLGVVNALRH